MKKIAATLMALALALSLAACGEDAGTTSSDPSSQAPVSSTPSESEPPADSSVPDIPPVEEEPSLNLALMGEAIVNGSSNEDLGCAPRCLNDGSKSTRWQAAQREGDGAHETEEDPSWFGVQWDEEQTFDSLFVLWESAHPEEDGFRVEISKDGETWEEVEFTSVRDGKLIEDLGVFESDSQTDTITLSEVVTAKAVRVVCFTAYTVPDDEHFSEESRGNTKSPTSVYEFEVYNSADVEAAEAEAEDGEVEDGETEDESADDTAAE